jgi:hypothetical protein
VSRDAREWVRDLGDHHLRGAVRALLWAQADRANQAGLFWTTEQTQANESGVSYGHVRRLLPGLVALKVLEETEPARGTRPAVYRFTLVDPSGLPRSLTMSDLDELLGRSSSALGRSPRARRPLTMSDKPQEPVNQARGDGSTPDGAVAARSGDPPPFKVPDAVWATLGRSVPAADSDPAAIEANRVRQLAELERAHPDEFKGSA